MQNNMNPNLKEAPIWVMDSGVGGISVLREAARLMPDEQFVFFGDSANAPYGTKTAEEVRELTLAAVADAEKRYHPKAFVIACNTATTAAVRVMRGLYPGRAIVGIEPALKPAADAGHQHILVLATPLTIKEEKFHALLQRFSDGREVIPLGCPGLMEYAESGNLEGPETDAFVADMIGEYAGKVDAVVLGCTHYPFLKKPIAKALALSDDAVYDGGYGTAKHIRFLLGETGLLRDDDAYERVALNDAAGSAFYGADEAGTAEKTTFHGADEARTARETTTRNAYATAAGESIITDTWLDSHVIFENSLQGAAGEERIELCRRLMK